MDHVIGTVWLNGVGTGCSRILSELEVVAKSMPIEYVTKYVHSYSLYSISVLKNLALFRYSSIRSIQLTIS